MPKLKLLARGKVRDIYSMPDEKDQDKLLFVATDRISAFDIIMDNVRSPIVSPMGKLTSRESQRRVLRSRRSPTFGSTSYRTLSPTTLSPLHLCRRTGQNSLDHSMNTAISSREGA
jgi:hypothetical protein